LCFNIFYPHILWSSRSQWPLGLRRRSSAARLVRLWIRIPPGAWMFVCCECCVLSGRGLCDELITRPKESYRLWCVVVSDLETSWIRRPCWPTGVRSDKKNYSIQHNGNVSPASYIYIYKVWHLYFYSKLKTK